MLLPGQVCVPGGGTSPLVTAADYRRGLIASPDEDDRVLLDRYKIRMGWLQQAREDAKAAGERVGEDLKNLGSDVKDGAEHLGKSLWHGMFG